MILSLLLLLLSKCLPIVESEHFVKAEDMPAFPESLP